MENKLKVKHDKWRAENPGKKIKRDPFIHTAPVWCPEKMSGIRDDEDDSSETYYDEKNKEIIMIKVTSAGYHQGN